MSQLYHKIISKMVKKLLQPDGILLVLIVFFISETLALPRRNRVGF